MMSENAREIYEVTEKDIIYDSEGECVEEQLLQGKSIESSLACLELFHRREMMLDPAPALTGILLEENPHHLPEKKQTRQQREIVESVLACFPEFLKKYGVTSRGLADPRNVFFIERKELKKISEELRIDEREVDGIYANGYVYLVDSGDGILEALTIVHEAIHSKSFQSPKGLVRGISIFNPKDEHCYFWQIDEAVVEELVMRFAKEYFPRIAVLSKKMQDKKIDHADAILYRMEKERNILNGFITDMYEKSGSAFTSPEEIFTIFAKAVIAGEFSNLAAAIDKAYGRGAFVKLGIQTKQKQ